MKTQKYVTSVLFAVLLIIPFNLLAQENEMPITTSSKEALQLFLAGLEKYERFEFTAGFELFKDAIQKDPNLALVYAYRAFRAPFAGQPDVAREQLQKALSLVDKVSEGEKHFIYFIQAFIEGNSSKQKEHIVQLTKLFPSDKRAQFNLGWYYWYSESDYATAIKYLKKSIELDDQFLPPYWCLGLAYSSLGNYEAAEKSFKTYIKLAPNSATSYGIYGNFLMKTRRYDEAIQNFNTAFEKNQNPEFTFTLINAGNIYCLEGDYKTARATYKRIYDTSKDGKLKMRSLYWQSVTYIYENNMTEALKLYKEYQSIAEQDKQLSNYRIWAYANFGNIHTELGDPIEGMKYYNKAIDLIDKVELGKSEKEKIIFNSIQWQANALIAQGELDKAKEILQKYEQQAEAKKDKSREKTLNVVRARLAMAEGNDDAALELLSKADASNPMTAYYRAVIYEKKGDKEKASELYKKIEEWTDNSIDLAFVRNKIKNK